MAGTFGVAGSFSFFPAKVLGCFGDGGAIIVDDDEKAEILRQYRDHGRDPVSGKVTRFGYNCRLDNVQAAVMSHFAQSTAVVGVHREDAIDNAIPLAEQQMQDIAEALCKDAVKYEFCVSDEVVLTDSTQRLRMWLYSLELFRSNPVVGVGREGYRLTLFYAGDGNPRVETYTYAHNVLFEYAAMYGLAGLLALALAFAVAAGTYVRAAFSAHAVAVLLALALSLLMSAMTGGNLFDIRYIFVLAAAVAFLNDRTEVK